MPNGFVGRPASAYLSQVSDANQSAREATTKNIERVNQSLQLSTEANTRANEAVQASRAREAALRQSRVQHSTHSMESQTVISSVTGLMQGSSISGQATMHSTGAIAAAARAIQARLIREPRPVRLPHPPESAYIGKFSSWQGNSTNIVVNQSEYESICHIVDNIDNNMGACIYNVANEIEEMCRTSFILPSVGPRCLNISDNLKRSLGEFRAVTEDSLIRLRRYVQDTMGIG